jgi:hypothetical protein
MQIGAGEQWLIGGGAGKPGGADISCSPTKLVPALLNDSKCFVTVAGGLQDWLGFVVRPRQRGTCRMSHVGRLLKPRFIVKLSSPNFM